MSSDPPSGQPPFKVAWHALQAALWFLLWIAMDHSSELPDLLLGAICALAMTALIGHVSLLTDARFGGRPEWVAHLLPVPMSVLRDNARVLKSIFTGAYRGEGHLYRVNFEPGGDNSRDAGRRSLVVAAVSTAPNTAVVEAPTDEDVLYVHTLVPPAASLGAADPRWPI